METQLATKRCPYCAEEILAAAIKCKHCSSGMPSGAPANTPSVAAAAMPVVPAGVFEATFIEKKRRINMINRRSVAWIIEAAAVNLVAVPVVMAFGPKDGAAALILGWLPFAVWMLVRDVLGKASFGKKIVGLAVATPEGSMPTAKARILRNVLLAIPLVGIVAPIVEFFVAYYGSERMERLGDKMAGTQIIDVNIRYSRGSWAGQLIGAVILAGVVQEAIAPMLTVFYVPAKATATAATAQNPGVSVNTDPMAPPPPPTSQAEADAIVRQLRSDSRFQALLKDSAPERLDQFLGAVSRGLETTDTEGIIEVVTDDELWMKRDGLWGPWAAFSGILSAGFELPPEITQRCRQRLYEVRIRPHLGLSGTSGIGTGSYDYTALAVLLRPTDPDYLRELIRTQRAKHSWWKRTDPPQLPFLNREADALERLASMMTTLTPDEERRIARLRGDSSQRRRPGPATTPAPPPASPNAMEEPVHGSKPQLKDSWPVDMEGELDPNVVANEIRRRKGVIVACYEGALLRTPNLSGKVELRFALSAVGKVTSVDIVADLLHDEEVTNCITNHVKGWRFPAPAGGEVHFSYPFVFSLAH